MNKHRGKFIAGFIALLLLSAVAWRAMSKKEALAQAETKLPDVKIEPISIQTAMAQKKLLIRAVSATGVAEAFRRVQISARLSAEILALNAIEGKFFRKGETLIRFNETEYQIAFQEAQDEQLKAQSEYATQRGDFQKLEGASQPNLEKHRLAKAALEEAKIAFKEKRITEAQLRTAKENCDFAEILSGQKLDAILRTRSGLARSQTALDRAELNLQNTAILAPFDGFASGIKVSQGQVVSSGQACLEFVDISRVKLEVGVLEKETPFIQVGNRCKVRFNAFPSDHFEGRVTAMSPVISTETKTAKAVIDLPNQSGKIKPGMYASADIEAEFMKDRLVVPKSAVVERDGRKVVFVREKMTHGGNDLAKWHYVQIGAENGIEVEILDGIKTGDEVVIDNNFTLSHDMPIVVKAK
jgi:multidrug efflux pump subunit AcrA (membrane-fusion protein)